MPLLYSLKYSWDRRKGAPEGAKAYFAQTRCSAFVDWEKVVDLVSAISTASRGDVKLILEGLVFTLQREIAEGRSVCLGELGYFKPIAGSTGSSTAEGFDVRTMMKVPKVRFQPGTLVKAIAPTIGFEKAAARSIPQS